MRLPFREGTFDAVTCRFAVHHFSDPEGGLAAMAAVLRPGGRLVVADFERPEDEVAGAAQDRLEALRGHVHVRIATRSQLKAMLAGAGCPVVAERDAEREVRPQDLLQGPHVSALPEQRAALDALVQSLERERTRGRRRVGRVSTASWCRSSRFSVIRSPRRRQAARSAASSRTIHSST